jgi:hypothetical protein
MRCGFQTAQDGYVAILAILIIGAASVAISLGIMSVGIDNQEIMLTTQQSTQARMVAVSCAEEALQKIHDVTGFTGTVNSTVGTDTCSYSITSTGNNTRRIDASSTIGNVVRKVQVYVTIGTSSISITSWQEVS